MEVPLAGAEEIALLLPPKPLPKYSRHAPADPHATQHHRSAAERKQDARWDRIYREKFEDPTYYSEPRLRSRSPQADF